MKTWQELHGPFYSALILEKVIMYLFLFLMFVIIAFHQRNSTLRLYQSKRREIAILRSIGMTKREVSGVLKKTAMIVSFSGVTAGLILGIFTSTHLDTIFRAADSLYIRLFHTSHPLLSYPLHIELKIPELIVTSCLILILTYLFTSQVMRKD